MSGNKVVTDEDIIEAISEWPITESIPYTDDRTEHIHNPASLSSFFLRNVGKPRKVAEKVREEEPGEDEVLVETALARWWKKTGRHLLLGVELPSTDNPNTLINYVAGTDEGLEFMQGEIRRLRNKLSCGSKNISVSSALSSFYERLGNLTLAKLHLEKVREHHSEDKEAEWRLARLERAEGHRHRQEEILREMDHNSLSQLTFPAHSQVERVPASGLSYSDFLHKYAQTSTPVIVTGLQITSQPWTLDHVSKVAGECDAPVKKPVKESVKFAHLEDCGTMKVKDIIDSLHGDLPHDQQVYLFDWSLPCHCPELAKEITIPKYFAGDLLQRTSADSLYQDSWPSLFIAPAGLTSELHVDTFGSNFWMALFQGKKRWTFFRREDISLLYPVYNNPWSEDPNFRVDLDSPDLSQFPLLAHTHPVQCVLEPGEVLFVPAGCPHRVENLESSLAISANYIDLSNLHLAQRELTLAALLHSRSHDLLEQLSDPNFPNKHWSDIDHMKFEEFKSWVKLKEQYELFDITLESVEKEQKVLTV
ncbi:uncharacterized protein LOC128225165 [Mya arenaria]|uniref:uncharacterized protein LOC128225165 n=1 Tax=Mya arenaria TaxID=6604 RepID=UPI0022E2AF7B|nr:uncharacterized protein LOC128225165 [Mya arenaria]